MISSCRSSAVLAFSLLLGCAQLAGPSGPSGPRPIPLNPVTGAALEPMIAQEEELDTAAQLDERIAADQLERPLGAQNLLEARIQRVFTDLTSVAHRPRLPWQVHVVARDTIGAFTLGGGYVYVYEGLFGTDRVVRPGDDEELAAVLGHMIAHIALQHTRIEQARPTALRIGEDLYASLSYTPDQEEEADRLAALYLSISGYDPRALWRVWGRAVRQFGAREMPRFFLDHPLSLERADRAAQVADRTRRYLTPGERNPAWREVLSRNPLFPLALRYPGPESEPAPLTTASRSGAAEARPDAIPAPTRAPRVRGPRARSRRDESQPRKDTPAQLEPVPREDAPAQPEPEPSEDATAQVEPEPREDATAQVEPEPSEDAPGQPEPEPREDATAQVEPEPREDAPARVEPEPSEDAPGQPEPVPSEDAPAQLEPVPREEAMAQLKPVPREEAMAQVEPEPREDAPVRVEPEPREDAPPQVETEPREDAPARVEAEPREDAPAQPEPEPREDAPARVEPEPREDAPARVEPEPREDAPARVEPEPREDAPAQLEPERVVAQAPEEREEPGDRAPGASKQPLPRVAAPSAPDVQLRASSGARSGRAGTESSSFGQQLGATIDARFPLAEPSALRLRTRASDGPEPAVRFVDLRYEYEAEGRASIHLHIENGAEQVVTGLDLRIGYYHGDRLLTGDVTCQGTTRIAPGESRWLACDALRVPGASEYLVEINHVEFD